ncbi:DUF4974 domain-containing protein [Formosa sediminum]|uniref:DUF4974 domain-containing protein n=1 Tax=Formosa sediminum TaxID=2594004 RepID=A0A516GUJ6_9FLAO|nr:FecR family protein [Formosa sediminum]QDO95193.1 DUF4974 domain-containing protein [Formosa sediminum]
MKEFSANKIIVKYLSSEATATEKEQLYTWVETRKNRKIFKEFVKAQQLIDIKYKSVDSESAFIDFLNQISTDKKQSNLNAFVPYLKYAAIFIGVCFATFYFSKNIINSNSALNPNEVTLQLANETINLFEDKVITNTKGEAIAIVENGILKYNKVSSSNKKAKTNLNILKVPYGKTFKVMLADGSLVQLNSGSVFKYPNVFTQSKPREVYLEGEGYFNVSKDKSHSFLVASETSIVKVFGTQFNVSSYPENCNTEIVLVEGSVGVKQKSGPKAKDSFQLITPSQKASLLQNSNTFEITDVDVQKYIGWTKGLIVFDNESLKGMIKTLERRYNVSIINNYNEINSLRFNGSFQKDSIEQILNTIKMHTNFSYTRKGKTIIITNPKN